MMKYIVLAVVALFGLATAAPAATPGLEDPNDSNLRMHPLYETTTWDLLEDMYLYHNAIRYFHNASGLHFNRTLTDYARLKALILAWYDGDAGKETGSIVFGENVHWANTTDEVNATTVIEDWYFNEEPKWNYSEPHVTPENKDFAQIVWKSSDRFGCGQAVSQGTKGGTYTVCYYDAPGAVEGQEADNVSEPRFPDDEGEDESKREATVRSLVATNQLRGVSIDHTGGALSPLVREAGPASSTPAPTHH